MIYMCPNFCCLSQSICARLSARARLQQTVPRASLSFISTLHHPEHDRMTLALLYSDNQFCYYIIRIVSSSWTHWLRERFWLSVSLTLRQITHLNLSSAVFLAPASLICTLCTFNIDLHRLGVPAKLAEFNVLKLPLVPVCVIDHLKWISIMPCLAPRLVMRKTAGLCERYWPLCGEGQKAHCFKTV